MAKSGRLELGDDIYGHYIYVITWSTVDYTSVTSIMHCRHVVTFLYISWLWQTSSSVSSSEDNRCREDAINMFRVRTTVIEWVMLAATVVVHRTLIKHRENWIGSLVFLIYLTIRMQIILKSESCLPPVTAEAYVYSDGSFFIWHNWPIGYCLWHRSKHTDYRTNKIIRPQEWYASL